MRAHVLLGTPTICSISAMVLVFLVVSQVTGERTAIVLGIYYMHRTAFLSVAARGPMVLYTGEPYSRGKCPGAV